MLRELLSLNVFGFFLIFARVGTLFFMMPGFGAAYVSIRFRLSIGLAVSFVMMPMIVGALPGMPGTIVEMVLLIIAEAVVGIFLGTIAFVIASALQTAGTVIAYFSSMANALIQDPIAEQQSSLFAGFLSTAGMVLIFVTDTHHLMLRAVADSYTLFVPGQPLMLGDFSEIIARRVADSFALGLQLASPLVITALTYYLGIGLLGRLMPQLPVFFFGMPIQITMQITVLTLSLSGILMLFLAKFEAAYIDLLMP